MKGRGGVWRKYNTDKHIDQHGNQWLISKVNFKVYLTSVIYWWIVIGFVLGWLNRGTSGKAYCSLCNKELHCHRLSLMKHKVTAKHQRNEERMRLQEADKLYEEKCKISHQYIQNRQFHSLSLYLFKYFFKFQWKLLIERWKKLALKIKILQML